MNPLYSTPSVDIFPAPAVSALSMQRLCDGLLLEMLQLKRVMSHVTTKVKRATGHSENEAFEWLLNQYQQTFHGLQSRLTQLAQESYR